MNLVIYSHIFYYWMGATRIAGNQKEVWRSGWALFMVSLCTNPFFCWNHPLLRQHMLAFSDLISKSYLHSLEYFFLLYTDYFFFTGNIICFNLVCWAPAIALLFWQNAKCKMRNCKAFSWTCQRVDKGRTSHKRVKILKKCFLSVGGSERWVWNEVILKPESTDDKILWG